MNISVNKSVPVVGKYDVVVANIVADVIIRLAPDIGRFLKDTATLIVSGIIDTREADVQTALAADGFTVTERYEQKG